MFNTSLIFLKTGILGLILYSSIFSYELTGHFDTEGQYFPKTGLDSRQMDQNFAISAEPEFYWSSGSHSILIAPFLRVDQKDIHRSHYDIREFYWSMAANVWELKVGIGKFYWGLTESQHVVDVLNQTDVLEGTDGEDKFGQPVINLTLIPPWGVLDLYVLPIFRERKFQGIAGRFRPPLTVDHDNPIYESEMEEFHPDFAARWFQTLGPTDFGLSYFYGTSREPELKVDFEIGLQNQPIPYLRPKYDLIHQIGIEAQWVLGPVIFKYEEIIRFGQGPQFFTLTGGFEYTLSNLFNSGKDVGILSEYHFDDREKIQIGNSNIPPNPLQDDIFAGIRLAFNDMQSTDLLGGVIVDRENQTSSYFVEATRRLGERWKLEIESRGFIHTDEEDLFHQLRKDDFIRVILGFYF